MPRRYKTSPAESRGGPNRRARSVATTRAATLARRRPLPVGEGLVEDDHAPTGPGHAGGLADRGPGVRNDGGQKVGQSRVERGVEEIERGGIEHTDRDPGSQPGRLGALHPRCKVELGPRDEDALAGPDVDERVAAAGVEAADEEAVDRRVEYVPEMVPERC